MESKTNRIPASDIEEGREVRLGGRWAVIEEADTDRETGDRILWAHGGCRVSLPADRLVEVGD